MCKKNGLKRSSEAPYGCSISGLTRFKACCRLSPTALYQNCLIYPVKFCEQWYNDRVKLTERKIVGADFSSLNGILEIIQTYVGDAVIDTLEVIPFLFVTYLLLEFMEHRMSNKSLEKFEKAGPLGPFIGSALGIIPQCGFSSAASTLYAGRVITIGTLFAVYLSTSDEMIPIFIAGGIPLNEMIGLLAACFFKVRVIATA